MTEMRLQKFLARAGVASAAPCRGADRRRSRDRERRASDRNGREGLSGRGRGGRGRRTRRAAKENATFLLHKPAGYVTTMSDPQGRPTVAELMADELLAPSGAFPRGPAGHRHHGVSAVHRRRTAGPWPSAPAAPRGEDVSGSGGRGARRGRRAALARRGSAGRWPHVASGRARARGAPMAAGPRSSSARGPVPSGYRQRHGGKRGRDALAPPGDPTWKCACARAATAKCAACWTPWGIR